MRERPKLLVISQMYPKPKFPALGIFVKRQVDALREHCDVVVVCPVRVFPPRKLFKSLLAGDVRMRSLQGETCQGVNLKA